MWALIKFIPFKAWLIAGAIAAGLILATGIFTKGYYAGLHKAEVASLKATIQLTQDRLRINEAVALEDQSRAALDAASMEELEAQIKDLNEKLSAPDTLCLDTPDTDRLRQLWKPKSR